MSRKNFESWEANENLKGHELVERAKERKQIKMNVYHYNNKASKIRKSIDSLNEKSNYRLKVVDII